MAKNLEFLGIPWGYCPEKERLIYIIAQNFMPIGVTIAEISLGHKKYKADDISVKMHTSIVLVDNKLNKSYNILEFL